MLLVSLVNFRSGTLNQTSETMKMLFLWPFREEWQWLQALSSLDESLEMDNDVQSAPHRLLQDLRSAIKDLIAHINVPGNQVRTRRLHQFPLIGLLSE